MKISIIFDYCPVCHHFSAYLFSIHSVREFSDYTSEEIASIILSNPDYFKCVNMTIRESFDIGCFV